eukprot:m.36432 g.36432  ORF g.36432 m.36432 type:complete len:722 (-) comp5409_c0_seq1:343-2508(-)
MATAYAVGGAAIECEHEPLLASSPATVTYGPNETVVDGLNHHRASGAGANNATTGHGDGLDARQGQGHAAVHTGEGGGADVSDTPPLKRPRSCCTWRRCGCSVVTLLIVAGLAVFGVLYVWPLLMTSAGAKPPPKPIPPGPPDNVTITGVTRSKMFLTWIPPEDSGTGTVVKYDVDWHAHNESWPVKPQLALASISAVVDDLLGSMRYCFRVRAVSSAGPGNYSSVACNMTDPPAKPDEPLALMPVSTSTHSITAGIVPGDANGDPIDALAVMVMREPKRDVDVDNKGRRLHGYGRQTVGDAQRDMTVKSTSNRAGTFEDGAGVEAAPEWEVGCIANPPCTHRGGLCSCVISTLVPGDMYKVEARANNSMGESAWRVSGHWHVDAPTPRVPAQPTNLTLDNVTASSVAVQWAPPTDDGGAMVTKYELEFARTNVHAHAHAATTVGNDGRSGDGGGNWTLVETGYSLAANVSRLLGGSAYCFRVRATNNAGAGPWSHNKTTHAVAQSDATTNCITTKPSGLPDAPVIDALPVRTSSTSITVKWSVPNAHGSPITNYTLQHNDWWTDAGMQTVYNGSDHVFTANVSLLPATVYTFRVRASSSVGTSTWSAAVNFSTDQAGYCGNPDDVAAYKRTKTTMKHDIQMCMIGCILKGEDCVNDCINKSVGLSKPCADCWYHEGACTLKNCKMCATNPGGQPCADCSRKACFPACVECSGVPQEFFPP